jgi:hypothetical protein
MTTTKLKTPECLRNAQIIDTSVKLALLDYEVKVARYTLRDLARDLGDDLVESLFKARDYFVDNHNEDIIAKILELRVNKHNRILDQKADDNSIDDNSIKEFQQTEQKKADDYIASLTETEIANKLCGLDPEVTHILRRLTCSLEVFAMICEDSNLIKFLKYKKADTVTYQLINEYESLQDDPFIKDDIIAEIDSLIKDYRDAVKEADFEHAEYIHEKLDTIYNNM